MSARVSMKLLTFAGALACSAILAATPSARASGGGGGGMSGGGMSSGMSDTNMPHGMTPAQLYQQALHEIDAHQYSDAVRDLRSVQRAAPNDPNIAFVLGVAYVGNNDNTHAREQFEHSVHAPNPPLGAFLHLGLLYLQTGNHDGAVAQQTALQTMLTACDAQCGDARRAQIQAHLDALTQAINAPPAASPSASPSTGTSTTTTPSPTTGWNFPTVPEGRAAYAAAIGLINQQRYSEALVQLDRAQAAIGPHPDILNYKGFTSRRLGRINDALTYYREALAIDPNHRGANEYLGELYLQMGRLADARVQLAKLDHLCAYGCAEHEELAHFIDLADAGSSTSAH